MSKDTTTHIPFIPKPREESISKELREEIEIMAKEFDKDPLDFRAKIELRPRPDKSGYYLASEIIYDGELKNR